MFLTFSTDRLPMTTITLKRTPTQRRHTGPPHKPKTYVQQLQAVNAAAKFKQGELRFISHQINLFWGH